MDRFAGDTVEALINLYEKENPEYWESYIRPIPPLVPLERVTPEHVKVHTVRRVPVDGTKGLIAIGCDACGFTAAAMSEDQADGLHDQHAEEAWLAGGVAVRGEVRVETDTDPSVERARYLHAVIGLKVLESARAFMSSAEREFACSPRDANAAAIGLLVDHAVITGAEANRLQGRLDDAGDANDPVMYRTPWPTDFR